MYYWGQDNIEILTEDVVPETHVSVDGSEDKDSEEDKHSENDSKDDSEKEKDSDSS